MRAGTVGLEPATTIGRGPWWPAGVRAPAPLRSGWSPSGIRVFAVLLVVFQVVQGLIAAPGVANATFVQSYFLITYQQGFVRRGLLGEVVHLLFGLPTRGEVVALAELFSLVTVAALLVLIEVLIRRRSVASLTMALLLAASPFTIEYLFVNHRPDLLALAVLVVLALLVGRGRKVSVPQLALVGLAFGVMVLVHEDVALIQVPWAVALVVAVTLSKDGTVVSGSGGAARELSRRLAALLAGPAVALAAVLAFGLPSVATVDRLRADVAGYHLGTGSMFAYLPDTVSQSFHLVTGLPANLMAHTLGLGAVLVALQLAAIVRWVGPGLWEPFLRRGNRATGVAVLALIAVGTVALFATGIDWLRWVADCGAAWLVAQAGLVLATSARRDAASAAEDGATAHRPSDHLTSADDDGSAPIPDVDGRVVLSPWLPALAVYLAAVPPLALATTEGFLHHFLLFS